MAEGGAKGQTELGRVLYDVSQVQSAVEDSLHNGALVLCNPGASTITDTDSQAPESQVEVHLDATAPKDGGDSEIASSVVDLSNLKDITDGIRIGHLGKRV